MANTLKNIGLGLARGMTADVLGMPVDTLNMLREGLLSPAAGGNPAARVLGGLLGPVQQTGSGDWFAQQMGLPQGEGMAYEAARMISPSPTDVMGLLRRAPDLKIFAGTSAKNADIAALNRAQEMEQAGISPKDIWEKTGWGRGTDNKWRFEIPDEKASLNLASIPESGAVPINSALTHNEFLASYGNLDNLQIGKINENNRGYFDASANEIRTSGQASNEDAKSIALHELQHAIQKKEGFSRGGSPNTARSEMQNLAQKEIRQYAKEKYEYDTNWQILAKADNALYIKSLEKLSQKDNPKPSEIHRLADWYKYSNEIRSKFGVIPNRFSPERNEWLRNAAKYIKDKALEDRNIPSSTLEMSEKELKNIKNKANRRIDKLKNETKKYYEIEDKYKKLGKLSDYEIYNRFGGEAEARLVQSRANMTPQQRSAQYPWEPAYFEQATGVPVRGLLHRFYD